MKNKIRFTCICYRYAPESCKCFMIVINNNGYNHSYYELKNFTNEENQKVGNICICKGKREAEAEIKKIVRSKKEYYNNITYGYKLLNENRVAYLAYDKINDTSNRKEISIR